MSSFQVNNSNLKSQSYFYPPKAELANNSGFIGYLRGYYSGNFFYTDWFDSNKELKSDGFRSEFDILINALREDGKLLSSFESVKRFCESNPGYKLPADGNYYGLRIDSGDYAYFFRFFPNEGDYQVLCSCYQKNIFRSHIERIGGQ